MRIPEILALLLMGGCVYLVLQRPRFSGSAPTVVAVRVRDFSAGTHEYKPRITGRAACSASFPHGPLAAHEYVRITYIWSLGRITRFQ
jgi:hypothetical protein